MTEQNFFLNGWFVDVAGGRMRQGKQDRHLEPKVMQALAYLASRAGDYVIGDTITVDGGLVHAALGDSIDA